MWNCERPINGHLALFWKLRNAAAIAAAAGCSISGLADTACLWINYKLFEKYRQIVAFCPGKTKDFVTLCDTRAWSLSSMAVTYPRRFPLQFHFLLLLMSNCCIKLVMHILLLICSFFHIYGCPHQGFSVSSQQYHLSAHYFSPFAYSVVCKWAIFFSRYVTVVIDCVALICLLCIYLSGQQLRPWVHRITYVVFSRCRN